MKPFALTALAAFLSAASSQAQTFTIEPASPLQAVPSGTVVRSSAAPIPGVDVAPERSGPPPAYAPEYGRASPGQAIGRAPVPEFNPIASSWCQMDLFL